METPVEVLTDLRTEAATGIKGMRLWIKGKSVEMFASEMRKLAAHLNAEANKLDPPKPVEPLPTEAGDEDK